jgi:putative membrane protein
LLISGTIPTLTYSRAIEVVARGEDKTLSRDLRPESSGHRLVYLAAERTLMAWVRTAAALMALGFVIDRFSLLLRRLNGATDTLVTNPQAFSSGGGPALVVLGALMAGVAAIRYFRFALYYHRKGQTDPGHGLFVAVLFSAFVAILGAVIAVFLLAVTD